MQENEYDTRHSHEQPRVLLEVRIPLAAVADRDVPGLRGGSKLRCMTGAGPPLFGDVVVVVFRRSSADSQESLRHVHADDAEPPR